MQPSQTVTVVNRRVSLCEALILAPFFLFHIHRWAATKRNHYLLALIHFFAFRLIACLIFIKISRHYTLTPILFNVLTCFQVAKLVALHIQSFLDLRIQFNHSFRNATRYVLLFWRIKNKLQLEEGHCVLPSQTVPSVQLRECFVQKKSARRTNQSIARNCQAERLLCK